MSENKEIVTRSAKTFSTIARKKDSSLDVKRGDSFSIDPRQLYIVDGFNVREIDQAHVDSFKEAYMDGEYVPYIEVVLVDVLNTETNKTEQKAKVIDGHHRATALHQLIAEGKEVPFLITVIPFVGNDGDEIFRMITSSQGRPLLAMERAAAYLRLVNRGLSQTDIAKRCFDTQSNVSALLKLNEAPIELQNMINNQQISHSRVILLMRSFGADKALEAAKIEISDSEEEKAIESPDSFELKPENDPKKKKKARLKHITYSKDDVSKLDRIAFSLSLKSESKAGGLKVGDKIEIDQELLDLMNSLDKRRNEIDSHNSDVDRKLAELSALKDNDNQ